MTLISTVISRLGIVQAADSNLTLSDGSVREGPKVFDIGFDGGVLALSGTYTAGGTLMDAWVPDVVQTYLNDANPPSLSRFAHYLGDRLTAGITPSEKASGSLIQVAGYATESGQSHPEMWFVRNVEGIDPASGNYQGRTDTFQVTEDFWDRDFKLGEVRSAVAGNGYQRYLNGFPPGRMAYLSVGHMLYSLFAGIWANPEWEFEPPSSLEQLASFVQVQMQTICVLFESSGYNAPYIGGQIQIMTIPPPPNTVAFSP